jgi:hypothetical protein
MSRRIEARLKRLFRVMNWYPPFLGAGIRISPLRDPYTIEVTLKLTWWNRNYVGTQFGGSLYSLCDPFFMLLLYEHLGPAYQVWDKAATIRFRRPGRGPVTARFYIPPERIEEIRAEADRHGKVEPTFTVQVLDAEQQVVAEVDKLLWVRRKDAKPENPS